jgi:hypothetical protein
MEPVGNLDWLYCSATRAGAGTPHRLLLPWSNGFDNWLRLHCYSGLPIHPFIEPRLLEAPAVAQLECRDEGLRGVFVERVRADTEVIRGLPDVHHFPDLTCAYGRGFHGRLPCYLVDFWGLVENWPATCLYRVFTLLFKDFMPRLGDSPLFAANFTVLQRGRAKGIGSGCGQTNLMHKLLCISPFDSPGAF